VPIYLFILFGIEANLRKNSTVYVEDAFLESVYNKKAGEFLIADWRHLK
jgi:hypothetical protein